MIEAPIELGAAQAWLLDLDEEHAAMPWDDAVLSSEERARVDRLRNPLHRLRQRRSAAITRRLLSRRLRVPPRELVFTRNRWGKPFISTPPTTIGFNLSHSENAFLFAVCEGADVGVDVEIVRPHPDFVTLARDHFQPEESARLCNLREDERAVHFFRFWTAKEALVKAVGLGLAAGARPPAIPVGADGAVHLEFDDATPFQGAWRLFHRRIAWGASTAIVALVVSDS